VLDLEITKKLVQDTRSDYFPKICIGREIIIELGELLRLTQHGELDEILVQAGIGFKKLEDRNHSKTLDGDSMQGLSIETEEAYRKYLKRDQVTIFAKSRCRFSLKAKKLFTELKVKYKAYDVDLGDISEAEIKS
jgi:hypothetical protein